MNNKTQNPAVENTPATTSLSELTYDDTYYHGIRQFAYQKAIDSYYGGIYDVNGEVIPLAKIIENYILNG